MQYIFQVPKPAILLTTAGRKTKVRRVSTFDRESDTESPAEDSAVDNTNAIMPYQDPTEFTHYLTDILDAEPGPQNWPTRQAFPIPFYSCTSQYQSSRHHGETCSHKILTILLMLAVPWKYRRRLACSCCQARLLAQSCGLIHLGCCRTGPPEGFRDVNSAFTEMKLASRGATDNLSQMPAIPVASNSMVALHVCVMLCALHSFVVFLGCPDTVGKRQHLWKPNPVSTRPGLI